MSKGDLFKIRVGVVVFDSRGRLLLVRQNNRPYWVLPGGTLEKGESVADCALREIQEEANLQIMLGPLLFVGDFFGPEGAQSLDVIFQGTLLSGTLQRGNEENIDEIGFFHRDEVMGREVKPEPVIQHILKSWSFRSGNSGKYLGTYSA